MASHRVNHIELELRVGDVDLATDLIERTSRMHERQLSPLLDRLLGEHSGPERIDRLDRIELDLGALDPDDFEGDLLRKLEAALRAALRQALADGRRDARGDAPRELLTTFATTGNLPWWADSGRGDPIAAATVTLLREAPAALLTLLADLADDPVAPVAWARLARHLDATSLDTIVGLRWPAARVDLRAALQRLAQQLDAAPQAGPRRLLRLRQAVLGAVARPALTPAQALRSIVLELADLHDWQPAPQPPPASPVGLQAVLAAALAELRPSDAPERERHIHDRDGAAPQPRAPTLAEPSLPAADPDPRTRDEPHDESRHAHERHEPTRGLADPPAPRPGERIARTHAPPRSPSPRSCPPPTPTPAHATNHATDHGKRTSATSRRTTRPSPTNDRHHRQPTKHAPAIATPASHPPTPPSRALARPIPSHPTKRAPAITEPASQSHTHPPTPPSCALASPTPSHHPTPSKRSNIPPPTTPRTSACAASQRTPARPDTREPDTAQDPPQLAAQRRRLGPLGPLAPRPTRPQPPPRSPRHRLDELYVEDAGLVILWPFLERFFLRVGLLDDELRFVDEPASMQAIALLAQLAREDPDPPEFTLPLAKLLVGRDPTASFTLERPLSAVHVAEGERLLAAVIAHATILRDMPVADFRAAFLRRPAALCTRDGAWTLQVERHTHDLLLARFPWAWSWVKLPWMPDPLRVEW
jgi:hypothetical protein